METVKSKAKCPKCKSNTLIITEIWHNILEFGQEDGYIEKEGILESGGVGKTTGKCCKCNHRWTFRSFQVTDLHIE